MRVTVTLTDHDDGVSTEVDFGGAIRSIDDATMAQKIALVLLGHLRDQFETSEISYEPKIDPIDIV